MMRKYNNKNNIRNNQNNKINHYYNLIKMLNKQ